MILALLTSACSTTGSSPTQLVLPDRKVYTAAEELAAAGEIKRCMDKDPTASYELCAMAVDYGVMRRQTAAAKKILQQ